LVGRFADRRFGRSRWLRDRRKSFLAWRWLLRRGIRRLWPRGFARFGKRLRRLAPGGRCDRAGEERDCDGVAMPFHRSIITSLTGAARSDGDVG
jgi:hypothetical protein